MKKNILGLFALVLAVGLSSFSVRAVTDWFEYDSSTFTEAQYKNPLNYSFESTTTPSSPGANNVLDFIKLDPATEKYTSGTFNGRPKVDVAGSLQSDILNATGISDGTVNEIMNRVLLQP